MPSLFTKLDLPADARRTFRFHLAYALLDAACGGILLNAPFVAIRALQAQNWQLPLREGCAGIGMLASLYLGSWMAPRRKMPFVFLPGVCSSLSALAMAAALAAGDPFWFLLCFGIGGMFEIVTRPAIAAILRSNYPVAQRGHVTATVRQWSSLSFVVSLMLAAYVLRCADDQAATVAVIEIVCAAALGLVGFTCFRQIRIHEDTGKASPNVRLEVFKNVRDAVDVVFRDARYRRYLVGCFLENFFGMLYLPFIAAFLSTTLGFGYGWCAALMHGIPTLAAFMTTGLLGWWFDRSNPWVAWARVRFAFGIDAFLLAATPLAAGLFHPLVRILPLLGRLVRGSTQGGWWILWWQIGVTHFAPPGENTSRYMGSLVVVNGLSRIVASAAGMALTSQALSVQPGTLLWIGGLGMMASGFYSLWQAARERKEHRPQTFAEFEAQFQGRQ
jgi:hypothetical protein